MGEHVLFEGPLLRILFVAYVTFMFDTKMGVNVPIQMTLLFITIRALIAGVRLLSRLKIAKAN